MSVSMSENHKGSEIKYFNLGQHAGMFEITNLITPSMQYNSMRNSQTLLQSKISFNSQLMYSVSKHPALWTLTKIRRTTTAAIETPNSPENTPHKVFVINNLWHHKMASYCCTYKISV